MSKKIFQKAGPDIYSLANRALESWHPNLVANNVRFEITTVCKMGEDDEFVQCLRLHGAPCAAFIKLVSAGDKVHVAHDAHIFIDWAYWDSLTEGQRLALLDHELEHLVIKTDKSGQIVKDDNGRVKLRMRPDDFYLTGFYSVVERHKALATEYLSVTKVFEQIQRRLLVETNPEPISSAPVIDISSTSAPVDEPAA